MSFKAAVENHALAHLKTLKVIPPEVIEAAVAFSGTARPQFTPDRVRVALMDWRGDLERYLMEQLDAAEVLMTLPKESVRLVVPGAHDVFDQEGQALPFYFRSELALMPSELEATAPAFAHMIVDLERTNGWATARGHLERAMAVTVWALLRLSIDDQISASRERINAVGPAGVDLFWRRRPSVNLEQDMHTWSLIVQAGMRGELVPKRAVTVEQSQAIN